MNDNNKYSEEHEKRMYRLEIIKIIFTPKLIWCVGYLIILIILMIKC